MSEGGSKVPTQVRRLSASDAADYRDLRLCGLQSHPEAFGVTWEEESAQPLAWFAERLDRTLSSAVGRWLSRP